MVFFSGLTPSKYHDKKMKKGFKDTKIKIKIQNKDQTGQGLDLGSCLYGFWQKKKTKDSFIYSIIYCFLSSFPSIPLI